MIRGLEANAHAATTRERTRAQQPDEPDAEGGRGVLLGEPAAPRTGGAASSSRYTCVAG
jgi:hypothetical protein